MINEGTIPENHLGLLQYVYYGHFPYYKVRITQRLVKDVANKERICNIIEAIHKSAHRNPVENKQQILESCYFPPMISGIKACKTCHLNKYDRHPFNLKIKDTPVSKRLCEILHLGIHKIQGHKFSKFFKFVFFNNKLPYI